MHSIKSRLRAHRNHNTVRSYECFDQVLKPLMRYVPISTQGENSQRDIHGTLIGMAAERQSIHSIQQLVSKSPTETTFRHHLSKVDIERLEKVNTKLLSNPIIDTLPRDRPYVFAIDYTDDPYYGQITDENESFVVGGQRKKSTNQFYRYATLYLAGKDRKYTIAALTVRKKVSHVTYIQRLLDAVKAQGFKIEVLLIDREFYGTEVFNYLQERGVPHIMPVKRHGKKMKQKLKGRRSRRFPYPMEGKDGVSNLSIAVDVQYLMGRYGKHGVINHGYVYYGVDWKPKKIAKVYRRRFGIEASYRMRNIVRPRTSTKDPMARYLMALVSLLLKNVWVAIKWRFFCPVRRGPRRVDEEVFRFDQYRLWIWDVFRRRKKMVNFIKGYRSVG